jgi:2-beta-glucuronyltransferase
MHALSLPFETVLIVTNHVYGGRKASIHFFADDLAARGADVVFLTVDASLVNRLRPGAQFSNLRAAPKRQWLAVAPRLAAFVQPTLIHPANLHNAALNRLSGPIYSVWPARLPGELRRRMPRCDLILVETGTCVRFVPALRRAYPDAFLVYKANDLLSTLGAHPMLQEAERRTLPRFDLVAAASAGIADALPSAAPATVIPHGIDKAAFDASTASPYPEGSRNMVAVGNMLFDQWVLEELARIAPEWTIHAFGVDWRGPNPGNVVLHGEQPFASIVPFVKFADIGIAPYAMRPQFAYLAASSLKIRQYSYCRLPIVAPGGVEWGRPNITTYDRSTESLAAAFRRAAAMPRQALSVTDIPSWSESVDMLVGCYLERYPEAARLRA